MRSIKLTSTVLLAAVLFVPTAVFYAPEARAAAASDPLVYDCLVQFEDHIKVPAPEAGVLVQLAVKEGSQVREGEVLHIPSWVPHQAEALEDTFELDLFSPIRQDWLDGTDTYFQEKIKVGN